MGENRLLLGSVAFGVSLGLSLLAKRDINTALLTGLISVPATFAGVLAINGKHKLKHKPTLNALQAHIYQLEHRKKELHHSFSVIATEKQRLEVNINFLTAELNQLYTQISERRSYKQQLSQEVVTLTEDKHKLEVKLQDLRSSVDNCEQRKEELHKALRSLRTQKQNESVGFNSIQAELQELQAQVTDLQHQKYKLENDLAVLKQLKPQLEATSDNLHSSIQQLEIKSIELDSACRAIAQEKKATEDHINLLITELVELQAQVLNQQNNKGNLEQELNTLQIQIQKLKTEQNRAEKLPEEWNQFVTHLTESEVQVLLAIIQQTDPSAEIKKIAEANITMPELLIDSINECALDTIGDLIIEPGTESIPLGITEEYVTNLNKAIEINARN